MARMSNGQINNDRAYDLNKNDVKEIKSLQFENLTSDEISALPDGSFYKANSGAFYQKFGSGNKQYMNAAGEFLMSSVANGAIALSKLEVPGSLNADKVMKVKSDGTGWEYGTISGAAISIQKDGGTPQTGVTSLNFVGDNITVGTASGGIVAVNSGVHIANGAGSVVSTVPERVLQFAGSAVTSLVENAGTFKMTVTLDKGIAGFPVKNGSGTNIVAAATAFRVSGAQVTVSAVSGTEAEININPAAAGITLDTSGFNNNLSSSITQVQQLADAVDNFDLTGANRTFAYVSGLSAADLSVNLTTNIFTVGSAKKLHYLNNNQKLKCWDAGTVTGIGAGTTYYLIKLSSTTFQLAATNGGSAIDLGGSTSSMPRFTPIEFDMTGYKIVVSNGFNNASENVTLKAPATGALPTNYEIVIYALQNIVVTDDALATLESSSGTNHTILLKYVPALGWVTFRMSP